MARTTGNRGRSKRTRVGDPLAEKRALIDARSEILITEFFAHLAEVETGGKVDPRVVFEAWAIQKIAGLQVLLLERAGGACE